MTVQTDRLQGVVGAKAVKVPVYVASTGNLTLSSSQVIDGVVPSTAVGAIRILAKDQTTPSENGIYDFASGTWSRAKDFDGKNDVVWGTMVYVSTGTENGGRFYQVTSTGNNIPGTDSITFGRTSLASTAEVAAIETISLGEVISNSDVSLISSDTTSTTSTALSISAPTAGIYKEVVIMSSATALTFGTTSTGHKIYTGFNAPSGSTIIVMRASDLKGASFALRGITVTNSTAWVVMSRTSTAILSS